MLPLLAVRSRPRKRLLHVYRQLFRRRSSGWQRPDGYDTGIKVYNTAVREKVPLVLSLDGMAKWYACGPTVYDVPHVGHACSYVRFDIIRRILERFFNIDVVMAMGITDVDDKIIRRAHETGVNVQALARKYEEEFMSDMNRLRVLPPTLYMRVTDHMDSIRDFCAALKEKGAAYSTKDGSLYFDVGKYPQYGIFRSQDAPAVEPGSIKKDPRDFALWKGAKPGEPKWTTPWGEGRPGWHVECSAMASRVFGSTLDLHTGGRDLAFPHHENEEAQSRSYHGTSRWVGYWLHSGHVQVKRDGNTEKMSKSLGNFVSIRDFLRDHSVDEFRTFCLRSPYHDDVELTPSTLEIAKGTLRILRDFVADAEAYVEGRLLCPSPSESEVLQRLSTVRCEVARSLADDFDYVGAVSSVVRFAGEINHGLQSKPSASGSARSPTAVAMCLNYVTKFMEDLGVELARRRTLQTSPHVADAVFANVLDSLVRFRNDVRLMALTTIKSAAKGPKLDRTVAHRGPSEEKGVDASDRTSRTEIEGPPETMDPDSVIRACDTLRSELFATGVQIKDRGSESTWSLSKDTSLEPHSDPKTEN